MWGDLRGRIEYHWACWAPSPGDPDWPLLDIMREIPDERARYRYFLSYYRRNLPGALRDHRTFFASDQRGFGEDAFHALWWKVIAHVRPLRALEIGVYRGQTISLWAVIAAQMGIEAEVWGISPLSSDGDSRSVYGVIDYDEDLRRNFEQFDLGSPLCFRALSQSEDAVNFIRSRSWDLVYVDGSHEFPDVCADIANVRSAMRAGSVLALDDASLYAPYRPYSFSFAGHPGPSQAAASADVMNGFEPIGSCGHIRIFRRI